MGSDRALLPKKNIFYGEIWFFTAKEDGERTAIYLLKWILMNIWIILLSSLFGRPIVIDYAFA